MNEPVCKDKRECFARRAGSCTVLSDAYPEGKCPFCKPRRQKDPEEEKPRGGAAHEKE